MRELGQKLIQNLKIENEPENIKLTVKTMLIEALNVNDYCSKEEAEKLVLTEE